MGLSTTVEVMDVRLGEHEGDLAMNAGMSPERSPQTFF